MTHNKVMLKALVFLLVALTIVNAMAVNPLEGMYTSVAIIICGRIALLGWLRPVCSFDTKSAPPILLGAIQSPNQKWPCNTQLSPAINEDSHSIMREEVEAPVESFKKGKSAGVDNIPAERSRQEEYL